MSVADRLSNLIGSIYDAGVEPERWPTVLRDTAQLVRADTGLLGIGSHRRPSAGLALPLTINIDPHHQRLWVETYLGGDSWWLAFSKRFEEGVLTGAQCVEPGTLHRTEIYNELLRRADVEDGLFAGIARRPESDAIAAFHRGRRRAPFGRREVDLLSSVLPHFQRAVRINDLLGAVERARDASRTAGDAISIGCVELDANGRFLRANAAGERILAVGDWLTVRDRRLRAPERAHDAELAAAIGRAISGSPRAAEVVALRSLSDEIAMVLHVSPIPREGERSFLMDDGSGAEVVVLITSPQATAQWSTREVARILGLTAAEAELVLALARGDDLKEHALARGIALGTVRWRMKRILEKTGSRRQSDVVRLVLMTLGRVNPPDGAST